MAVTTSAGVVLVVLLVSTVIFALYPGRGNASASFIPTQPGSLAWDGHTRLNVALLGTASGRLKATSVVSFTPSSSTLDIVGVPANLWVDVPGFGQGTLADAYQNGGSRLVRVVLEATMAVPIRYQASVSAPTFGALLSEIGAQRTTAYPNRDQAGRTNASPAAAEEDLLRWQSATLAGTLRTALSASELFKIPAVVNMLGGSIPTNFPYNQVPEVAHRLLTTHHLSVRYQYLTPANGTVAAYAGTSGLVWLPDVQRIRSLIRPVISEALELRRAPIQVLNGTGTAGVALAVSGKMSQAGFNISGVGDAQPQVQDHTVVRVSRNLSRSGRSVATDAAAMLGTEIMPWTGSAAHAPITIIVGRDFQAVSP